MKRFATFFMAAILGSLCTIGAVEYFKKDEVALSYMTSAPVQQVSYTHDETGREVPLDFTAIAEKATPAVVFIKNTQQNRRSSQDQQIPEELRQFFGQRGPSGPSVSSGSGVIISEGGYIVTNNHVVADADAVEVTLNDNRTFQAEVIGTDPDTDLALIKINTTGLKYMSFVNSDHSRVGEWVVAVGNPFNLTSTVTAGIISAKSRNINIINRSTEEGNVAIESFIQTDAAINPGNSGGALVDMSGGLLGINTAIASNTGSYNGYGFAVPANIVSKVVEDLIKFGTVQRGWLGVSIGSVNSELVKKFSLEVNEGAYVSGFAGKSAAKDAGIKEGDVVVKINETPIRSSSALIETVGSHRPGDKLNITVNRAGKEITYPVVLKNREGNEDAVKAEDKSGYASLGAELQDVDAKELKTLDLTNGVKITGLNNGKLSRYTDVREGFIVTKINDKPVKSVKEFNEIMKAKKAGDLVILTGTYADLPREFNYAFRM